MIKTFEEFRGNSAETKMYRGRLVGSGEEIIGQLIVFKGKTYILSDDNIFEGDNTILIGADEETLVDENTVEEI